MSKYLILILSLTLVACKEDKTNNQKPQAPAAVEMELKSANASLASFGDVAHDESKIITLKITNNGDEILAGPASLGSAEFSLVYQSGCANLKVGSSCTVKLAVNAQGKTPGLKTSSLNLDAGVAIQISANILSPPSSGTSISVSSETLDFGSLTQTSTVVKNLTITNSSTTAINQVINLGSSFIKTYDNCSGVSIAPGGSCLVKISLSGAGKSGTINETLQLGTLTPIVSLTAVVSDPPVASEQMVLVYGATESETGLSFGVLPVGKASVITFYLKNKGSKSVTLSPPLQETSSSAYLAYDGCSGLATLASQKQCMIKLAITPVASENFSLNVNWGLSKSFALSYTVPTIPVGPLSISNLNEGQAIYFADLSTDVDGYDKFTLNGQCLHNGEEITIKIDEFEGQEFDGMPMTSSICYEYGPPNYDCDGAPAVLTTTCQSNQFSVKLPVQHIIDFWYWAAYGGEMELKLNYSNPAVALTSPLIRNFKNYAAKAPDYLGSAPGGFGSSHMFQSVWGVNARSVYWPSNFGEIAQFAYSDIFIGYNSFSSRLNNPRTPLDTITYDYHYNHIDSSGYPVIGEIKFSYNNTCSGGIWKRGTSLVDESGSIHYLDLLENIFLPTDGSVQYLSFKKRDPVTGQESDCYVKEFQYVNCPNFPAYCDANNLTVPYSVETYAVPGP